VIDQEWTINPEILATLGM